MHCTCPPQVAPHCQVQVHLKAVLPPAGGAAGRHARTSWPARPPPCSAAPALCISGSVTQGSCGRSPGPPRTFALPVPQQGSCGRSPRPLHVCISGSVTRGSCGMGPGVPSVSLRAAPPPPVPAAHPLSELSLRGPGNTSHSVPPASSYFPAAHLLWVPCIVPGVTTPSLGPAGPLGRPWLAALLLSPLLLDHCRACPTTGVLPFLAVRGTPNRNAPQAVHCLPLTRGLCGSPPRVTLGSPPPNPHLPAAHLTGVAQPVSAHPGPGVLRGPSP